MVKKIQALGKEIALPVESDIDARDSATFLSLLRDLDPETASQLDGASFSLRIEGDALVVYRDSAVMG